MNSSTEEIASPLLAVLQSLSSTAATVEHYFHKLPGSPILVRYIRSSYQVGFRTIHMDMFHHS
jgi:serine palmitoyltransferase